MNKRLRKLLLSRDSAGHKALAGVLAFALASSSFPVAALGADETQEVSQPPIELTEQSAVADEAVELVEEGGVVDGQPALVEQVAPQAEVSLWLAFEHGYINYSDQIIAAPTSNVLVPAGKDLVFVALPDEGHTVVRVAYADAEGEHELGGAMGLYTIPAFALNSDATLIVVAERLETTPEVSELEASTIVDNTVIRPQAEEEVEAEVEAEPVSAGIVLAEPALSSQDITQVDEGVVALDQDQTYTLEGIPAEATVTSTNDQIASVALVDGNYVVSGKAGGEVTVSAVVQDGDNTVEHSYVVQVSATDRNVSFDANGGSGQAPEAITARTGSEIELPDYSGTKAGYSFVGWSTDRDAAGKGSQHYTQAVYAAGDKYLVSENTTLFAVWAESGQAVTFALRTDGVVATEPQQHAQSDYVTVTTIEGAVKTGQFVADSSQGVDSYLDKLPSDAEIAAAVSSYNPATQHVLWYVLKSENSGWRVEGTILDNDAITVSYDANCPAGSWSVMPDGAQYAQGEDVTVAPKSPVRKGYVFAGWNTAADGTGTSYEGGDVFVARENVTLFAQWELAAPVTITLLDAEFEYDGEEHTAKGFRVDGQLNPGDRITKVLTDGVIVDAGTVENNITHFDIVDTNNVSVKSNYPDIELKPGKLTVIPSVIDVYTDSASKPFDGSALTATEEGTLALYGSDTINFTVTGSQTFVGRSYNSYEIEWGDVNPANYSIVEHLGVLEVTTNDAPVTIYAPSGAWNYDGEAHTAPAVNYKVEGLGDQFTLEASFDGGIKNVGTASNKLKTYTISCDIDGEHYDVTDWFTNVNSVDGTLIVDPTDLHVYTAGAIKLYDGTPLTAPDLPDDEDLYPDNFLLYQDDFATIRITGSQTEVGSSDNNFEIEWESGEENYTIFPHLGKLVVYDTVGAADFVGTYDGNTHSIQVQTANNFDGARIEYSTDQLTWSTTAPDFVDATADEGVVVYVRVVDTASGEVVASTNATVRIVPRPITITTESATKTYDGQPLSSASYEVSGLVDGETVSVATTGSQTRVGGSYNTYVINWDGTAKQSNYRIARETLGELVVRDAPTVAAPPQTDVPAPAPTAPTGGTSTTAGTTTTTTPQSTGRFTIGTVRETSPIDQIAVPVATALQDAYQVITGGQPAGTLVSPSGIGYEESDASTTGAVTTEEGEPIEEQILDDQTPEAVVQTCWTHFFAGIGALLTAVYGLGVFFNRKRHTRKLKNQMNSVLGGNYDDSSVSSALGEGA
ncbi:MAG: InlB B-repeat-containing protein [Atopobiaceae bacterium]|nr:InlB B-repeat-containing protein [Atopobiaceae bacterium]